MSLFDFGLSPELPAVCIARTQKQHIAYHPRAEMLCRPCRPSKFDPVLAQQLFGLDFPNPLGLAPGFDKNADVPDAMLRLGFGFVEVGTLTPRAQRAMQSLGCFV